MEWYRYNKGSKNNMNWYQRYIHGGISKKNYIPENDYRSLLNLVDKIISGDRNWTKNELQLQSNYSEALEVLLKEKYKNV